jgi:hypothetical protein
MLSHTAAVQKQTSLGSQAVSCIRVSGCHRRFDLDVHFGPYYLYNLIIPYSSYIHLNQEEVICQRKHILVSFMCQK